MTNDALIGRVRELEQIGRRVRAARSSAGGCVVLCGEPGIGKTTLLEAAATAAAGFTTLRTRGVQSDAELPFAALVELLRPVTAHLSQLPDPQAAALEVALALRTGPPANRLILGAALLNLLAAVSDSGSPVLVLVDDAQWIDEASAEVLLFAAHRLSADAVLMLVGERAENESRFVGSGLEYRRLGGLTPEETSRLADLAAGRPLGPEAARRLYAATAGNPLGVVELAVVLAGLGLKSGPGSEATTPSLGPALGLVTALPPRLEAAFVSRLAKLSPDAVAAALVTAASPVGDHRVVVAALAQTGIAAAALIELEQAGLLNTSGAHLTFRHPLVRSAVYGSALPAERRAAHSELAQALAMSALELADPAAADERAWHLAAAASGPDESAAAELDAAADRAHARGSLAAAAAAYARAAELSLACADRTRRLIASAEANLLLGRYQEALALLPAMATSSPELLARSAQVQLQVDLVRASPREVNLRLVAVADAVATADPAQAVALLTSATGAAAMSGDALLAAATSARADRLSAGGAAALRGSALALKGHSLLLTGHVDDATAALDGSLLELGSVDSLRVGTEVHPFLAMALMWAERWDESRAVLRSAARRARSAAPERMINLLAVQAELEYRMGRWDLAVAHASEAVDLAVALEQPIGGGYALATWAQVTGQRGDDATEGIVARGRSMLSGLGAGLIEPYLDLAAAGRQLAAGEYATAARLLSGLDGTVTATGARNPAVVPYRAMLVEASWWAGAHDEARRALEAFSAAVRDHPAARAKAEFARCRALMRPSDERFAVARACADEQADPFVRARALLSHGQWLRRQRRRGEARPALEESLEIMTGLHAQPWLLRTQQELRVVGGTRASLPGRVSWPGPADRSSQQNQANQFVTTGGTTPAPPELTPQELQVASLVVNGATNREAAASLYISAKTVEYHLGHVYDKLGVRSRVALANRLAHLRVDLPTRAPTASPS